MADSEATLPTPYLLLVHRLFHKESSPVRPLLDPLLPTPRLSLLRRVLTMHVVRLVRDVMLYYPDNETLMEVMEVSFSEEPEGTERRKE